MRTLSSWLYIVEVTVSINGILLRGEESTMDMYTSIDLVVEKLERQIEKHKTKLARKFRQVSFKEAVVEEIKEAPEVEDFQVVKTKRFAVKPMDIQEAIMQMNLINHDFFVFRDAKTEAVNVVYRRKDGKYGLIDPEA